MLWLQTSDLPTSVVINEHEYPILSDFRTWIRVDSIIQDKAITQEMKLPVICMTIGFDLNDYQDGATDLWHALVDFFHCGKKPKDVVDSNSNGRQAYRFEYDMDLIYAAFRQQYNINLLTADLHWYEFKALFNGLSDETQIIKVMGYRTRKLTGLKGEELKQAKKLELFYRLPDDEVLEPERTPQEIEAELLAKLES